MPVPRALPPAHLRSWRYVAALVLAVASCVAAVFSLWFLTDAASLHELLDSPLPLAVCGAGAIGSGFLIAVLTNRLRQPPAEGRPSRGSAAVVAATMAALVCTASSADTSWRFARDYLAMHDTTERAVIFAGAELALFATALMARQNLHGPRGAAGMPGVLVWVITAVQAIPSYAEFGPVGGTIWAFIGPVMAAALWHLAMGIELRQHRPDAASRSLPAILVSQARERLLARLGIVGQNQGAAHIAQERALRRAVGLAARLAARAPEKRTNFTGRHLTRRLAKALARTGVDDEPARDELLLRALGTRRQAAALATIELPPRWAAASSPPDDGPRAVEHARSLPESELAAARPHPQSSGGEEATASARPEQPPAHRAEPDSRPPEKASTLPGGTVHRAQQPARKRRTDGKPRASDRDILVVTRQLYTETGSVSRDRVEEALRIDGYTVSSDDAGRVVRDFKANLSATPDTSH